MSKAAKDEAQAGIERLLMSALRWPQDDHTSHVPSYEEAREEVLARLDVLIKVIRRR